MIEAHYLEDCLLQLRKVKRHAEKAISQVEDEQLFAVLDPEANSIGVLMKHLAGNMRSRWTEFLTSDGEKPDRDRDGEFDRERHLGRGELVAAWDRGWDRLFQALEGLGPEHLDARVRIRGEELSVVEALLRQVAHYAAHVGQMVFLAKHLEARAGRPFPSLSIPRGQSRSRSDWHYKGRP
jgi:hypothetical protein